MAIEIDWSDEAIATFDKNVYYLESAWTEKEVAKFIKQTQKALKRIEQYPESYPVGKRSNKYRRARINKYIALFYRYNKVQGRVALVTFWNVKQDPSKLKY
ncbi:MAG TPA: type II toxin-antitoxin system RelE/ParE family toxin [Puia sp.]|nr:type II toxin-antitoxin system RelE/ParE family toxin [Puia sp.]